MPEPIQSESRLRSLGHVLAVSWPASVTMLNTTIVRFVDGLMVSRVGPEAFSAQLVAAMTSFVPESFFTGLLMVVATYVSQNLGAGRHDRCGQYAWAGLGVAWLAPLLIAPLALLAPWIFADLMGHDEQLAALETMYLRYMILAAGFALSCRVMEQFFFGVHRPRLVLIGSLVGLVMNIVLNYILIFGHLGLPAMGLQGAAVGTVGALGVQFVVLLAIFLAPGMHRRFATRRPLRTQRRQLWDLLRIGWPAGIDLSSHIFHWVVFVGVLVAYFGTLHMAAATAALRWTQISVMPIVGVALAGSALVGRCIGAGRRDLARSRTHTILGVGLAYAAFCGLAFIVLREPMVRLFVNSQTSPDEREQIVRIGSQVLVAAAVFQVFDGLRILYFGALRGAGDTRWPMLATILCSWTISLGGGWAMITRRPDLQSLGPWLMASAFAVVSAALLAWRFETGAWMRVDLLGRDAPAAVGWSGTGAAADADAQRQKERRQGRGA